MKRNEEDAEVGEGSLPCWVILWWKPIFGAAQCDEQPTVLQPRRWKDDLEGEGPLWRLTTCFLKTAKCWTPAKSLTHTKKLKTSYPQTPQKAKCLLKCGILSEHCNDTGAWKSGRGLWRQLPLLGVRMEEQVCLRSSGGITFLCPPSSFSINPCCPLLPALFPPNLCSHYISLQLDHFW